MLMMYFLISTKRRPLILFFAIDDLSIFSCGLLFLFFVSFYSGSILQNDPMNIGQFYEMAMSMPAFSTADS